MSNFKITSQILLVLSILSVETLCIEVGGVNSTKVPKCCPQGEKGWTNCTQSSDPRLHPFRPWKDFETYTSPLNCSKMMVYDPADNFSVDKAGFLIVEYEGAEMGRHSPETYCFDFFSEDVVPFFCVDEDDIEEDKDVPLVYSICMIVSTVCLASIAVIYTAYRTLRENPHSPYLVSHTVALALAYACLVTVQLGDDTLSIWCHISGFGVQYFFLAAFFWLNSMSVDIFMTLSEMRPTVRRNSSTDRKFLYFSLYSWGCPILVTVSTIILTHVKDVPYHYRPDIGVRNCILSAKPVRWIYLHGPIALLIVVNVTIFVLTAIKLLRHRSASLSLSRSRNTLGDHTRHFFLYLKLFIVMGISWSTEILSFMFDKHFESFWFVTDLVNALQGFLIFLLFVCKENVITLLTGDLKIVTNLFSSKNPSNRSSKTMTPLTSVVYTENH
ncbi:g-protein coupled receptor [Nesidiocoris tenuis]|uniref:G-protein coupled receptor n=1 Tax=Nesidiocoris tenuis TaxID=355587 RepID=A0ABN7AX08_9HEMI|nr:g-protein coupled receptor [Nesidiocoris tenuis]